MKILALNPGSTTLKCALFENKKNLASFTAPNSDHALAKIFQKLKIEDPGTVDCFGIRIVHGGEIFSKPKLLGTREIRKLEKLNELAPLHNKPALRLIKTIRAKIPNAKIVGVFDTNFHRTLSAAAQTIPINKKLADKFGIRKYGFHGIACESILRKLRERGPALRSPAKRDEGGKLPQRIMICHLGGGASITAVRNGKSVETSMSFTPTAGLPMLTRSGDLDPGVFEFLAKKTKKSPQKVLEILNEESGIFGLTGEKDFAKIVRESSKNANFKLAVDVFVNRIVEKIFASAGTLGGVDLLIFSGGIGSNSAAIRKKITNKLKLLKIKKIESMRTDELGEIAMQAESEVT